MNDKEKPSHKHDWTPSEIMLLAIITTAINVITVIVNALKWL